MKRIYRITYVYRAWKREPHSPFASAYIDYSDPSAAHERAMKLRSDGMHNVTIKPHDTES